MSAPQWGLLTKRRFWPLFVTQFLGAFNDNLYRSAMLFLVSFSLYRGDADKASPRCFMVQHYSRSNVPRVTPS